jgi:ribosomal protein S12 methylthiotransferase accessory factor
MFHVVPLLDGTRTVDEIAAACPALTMERVNHVLDVLMRDGHLIDSHPMAPRSASAFWSEFDLDTKAVAVQLQRCRLEVTALGVENIQPFIHQLSAAGIQTTAFGGNAHVAVVDDYGRPELDQLNRSCLERGIPLFLLKPLGVKVWIGPVVVPGRTACWQCLKTRLTDNRPIESFLEARMSVGGPFPVNRSRSGLGELQAYAMATTQIAYWLVAGTNPNLESRLVVADLVAFDFSSHHVRKLPDCAACGDPRLGCNAGEPIRFEEIRTYDQSGAAHRSEPPDITFERLKHHISPYTGIVSHVEKGILYGQGPIRTYIAGHNFALKSNDLWFLKDGLRTHSSGKGWTDAQAKTSALCEAIERHSGVYRANEPRKNCSLRELGDSGVDPRTVMLYSDRQYREREDWIARRSRFQIVPVPFDDQQEISWTPTWSLSQNRVRYLPTSYLFYNFLRAGEPGYCWADSNGAAAGRSLVEAMQQGLFELIERDAVCLWWYNRLKMPGVDLAAFADSNIVQMREFFARVGRELWVLDLTADLDIPVFVAISRRSQGPTEDIMMGFGAHLDARIALTRALTELNQFIPSLLNIGPDGQTHYLLGDKDAIEWWTKATVANQPYLLPDRRQALRPASFYKSFDAGDGVDMFKEVVGRLERRGLEVIVVDQTRPGVDLAVAKMIVPGLRHFWARYAPGRLYDVPVQLGLLERPTREEDLNPTPMFL